MRLNTIVPHPYEANVYVCTIMPGQVIRWGRKSILHEINDFPEVERARIIIRQSQDRLKRKLQGGAEPFGQEVDALVEAIRVNTWMAKGVKLTIHNLPPECVRITNLEDGLLVCEVYDPEIQKSHLASPEWTTRRGSA